MGAILKNGAVFLHIPKTGGTWVESVLKKNGLISEYLAHRHVDFDRHLLRLRCKMTGRQHLNEAKRLAQDKILTLLGKSPHEDPMFRFCFVRHPLSWYESWWRYMMGRGWNDWGVQNYADYWHPSSTLNGLGSDDFNQFVRNVIRERPGYVSELFFSYTKPGISFIGKAENLRDDLAYILDTLGVKYHPSTIKKSERVNVSKAKKVKIQWDPDLKETVMRLELPALIHFGYLSEQEQRNLGVSMKIAPNRSLHQSVVYQEC